MKLTIGIPTYNRASKLESVLIQISEQLKLFNQNLENIEIIVSNNSSVDSTPEVLEMSKSLFNCKFKYYTQKNNIGFDRNVDFLFKKASGDFLWILSDDDILVNDSIKILYTALKKYQNVSFAFINYNTKIEGKILKSKLGFGDEELINSYDLMTKISFANSFISSCVFSVSKWNSINSRKYFDTAWIHVYMARDILITGKSLIIKTPLVEMQQYDQIASRKEQVKIMGIEFYFYAHINMVKFCSTLSSYGYPIRVQNQAIKYCKKGDIGHIFNLKIYNNKYDINEIFTILKEIFPYRKKNLNFYFIFIPAILLPGAFYKLLYTIKHAI